jgi:hypothetical protein
MSFDASLAIAELKYACEEAVPTAYEDRSKACCLCGAMDELHRLHSTHAWLCNRHNKLKEERVEEEEQWPF